VTRPRKAGTVDEFYKKLGDRVEIRKLKVEDGIRRAEAVRVYCTMSDRQWNLQIFGPMRIKGGDGKDDVVATATLNRDQVTELRNYLTNILAGIGQEDRGIAGAL